VSKYDEKGILLILEDKIGRSTRKIKLKKAGKCADESSKIHGLMSECCSFFWHFLGIFHPKHVV
jgi:hypothetical protein